jgi:hypothetical protein
MASSDPGPGYQPGDVAVPATVSAIAVTPVVRASDLQGSHRTVDTLAERDAIPSNFRDEGMSVWVTATNQLFRAVGGITNGDWALDTSTSLRASETYTPLLGQTVFTLSFTPAQPSQVDFLVNEAKFVNGSDYTVVGTTLTWLDVEFTLDPGDKAEAIYFL